MAHYILHVDPILGQRYLIPVEDDLGDDPGMGVRRSRDLLERLPDAELAGYYGPGVVAPSASHQEAKGRASGDRPLAGLQPNAQGASVTANLFEPSAADRIISIVEARNNGKQPESLLVTLGLEWQSDDLSAVPGFGTTVDHPVQARIEWGNGGASFTAYVDWMQGTTLTIPAADFCRVAVVIPAYPTLGDSIPDCTFSAALAYGAAATHRNRARRTVLEIALGVGLSSTPIPVPQFAVSLGIQTSVQTAPIAVVQNTWTGAAMVPVASNNYASVGNGGNLGSDMIPIHAQAKEIVVTNNGADPATISVVFELAL